MRARLILATVGLVAALVPVSAGASAGDMTVTTVTRLQLTNRVLVAVPVSVVCTDFPGLTATFDDVTVAIKQASGHSTADGRGELFGGGGNLLFTCDGTTVNRFVVPVLTNPGSSPFHGGPAIATVFAFRQEGLICGVMCLTNVQNLTASTGPVPVKLR